jgi:hypothetical protein
MALVTGPLMSMDASGTIGETLTFGKWKGRNYVRQRVIPANPKSASQLGVRSMMSFLAKQWTELTAGEQASYAEMAEAKSISAFNQFVSVNLTRWQNFDGPTKEYPAAEASTPLTVSDMTLTGGVGEITVQLTPSGSGNIWGFVLCRDPAEITAPAWSNCIAVIEADAGNQVTHVDSPLDAGTYHYRAAVINDDGVMGSFIADDSEAAT